MIGKTISHYRILEKLGAGGMGVVYKAEDTKLKRNVALKFLPQGFASDMESRERFIQEAQAASALDHPNIYTIHEIDEHDDDQMFIAMAYYDGETLMKKIEKGPLPLDISIDIAIQVGEGLAKAHERGIVHRDIKPSNIIVTNDGVVKVVDFGLAKLSGTTQLTKVGSTIGTVKYMSPEQTVGESVDHRTDIWSIGVILYEMITGQVPFTGDYDQAIGYSVLNEDPIPMSELRNGIDVELEQITDKALAKQLEERFQNIDKLLNELKSLRRFSESGTASVSTIAKDDNQVKLRRFLKPKPMLVGFLAVLLLVLISIWILPSSRESMKSWLGFGTIPDVKHIAVLSFTNIGENPANKALVDGLVETLTSKLSQLEQFQGELWVVPASEVRKNKVTSASESLQKFGTNLVVTGSVQQFSSGLRLIMNLVDAESHRQLDSKMIDDPMTNASILQDEAVIRLAEMMDVQLHPQTRRVLTAGGTTEPGAYEFYLRGRGILQRYDKLENINSALGLFERALKEDPNYALAYAGLGEAYLRKFQTTKDVQWIEHAVNNCERAVEMDDLLAPVHVNLGQIHSERGRYKEALDQFQKALELDPVNSEAYRGRAKAYQAQGKLTEAESTYKKAIEMKPDFWAGYNSLGIFYFRHGRYEDAIPQFRHVIELTPQNAKGYLNLGSMFYSLDRRTEAIEMYKRVLEIEPQYSAYSNLATLYYYDGHYKDAARMYEKALEQRDSDYRVWGYLATAYGRIPDESHKEFAAYQRALSLAEKRLKINPRDPGLLVRLAVYNRELGERDKALSLLQQAVALQPKEVNVIFRIGSNYARLGERELALEWIERALDKGYAVEELERNPGFAELRDDERYQKILQKHKEDKQ